MRHHLEDLYNKWNNIFQNGQSIMQLHAQVRDPFRVQDRPAHFIVTGMKNSLHGFKFHIAASL